MEPTEYELMDAAEDQMWWYRAAHAQMLDALVRRPGPAGRGVLDAGCGTGGLLRRLREVVGPGLVVGMDYHAAAARRAGEKARVPVAAGDVSTLPFADASFGAAVSADVLCHRLVDPERALAELRRVLAPGGTLVLNLPAFEWLKSAHDVRVHTARRFTAEQATRLLHAAGFQRVEARYWNALLLPLMVLRRKVVATRADDASDVAPFPPWLDRTLHGVASLERRLSSMGVRYPAGGSVLAVATRP
jgi:ubiquinone/menaquinone biosynthesis C-methylase UbiE